LNGDHHGLKSFSLLKTFYTIQQMALVNVVRIDSYCTGTVPLHVGLDVVTVEWIV